mmetsp:Transcript_38779/g.84377  ORF Transcript_38779/g.84377 Transcript_38779/m.84377 type:complete len:235 (-) Transcript_38779:26-730(-)
MRRLRLRGTHLLARSRAPHEEVPMIRTRPAELFAATQVFPIPLGARVDALFAMPLAQPRDQGGASAAAVVNRRSPRDARRASCARALARTAQAPRQPQQEGALPLCCLATMRAMRAFSCSKLPLKHSAIWRALGPAISAPPPPPPGSSLDEPPNTRLAFSRCIWTNCSSAERSCPGGQSLEGLAGGVSPPARKAPSPPGPPARGEGVDRPPGPMSPPRSSSWLRCTLIVSAGVE